METGVITPTFRASYLNIFEPKENNKSGKLEYYLVAMFEPKEDLSELKNAVIAAAQKLWGVDQAKWPKNLRMPFRKAEEKETNGVLPNGMLPGSIFINLKTQKRPGIVDQSLKDIISKDDLWSGCYCRAKVVPFAYDKAGNRGVSLSLRHVQKVKDGERLSNDRTPQEEFTPIILESNSAQSFNDLF